MQTLGQNKQEVYYSTFSSMTDIVDSNGMKTGEKRKVYHDPVLVKLNVSAAKGVASDEPFGIEADYSRTMITHDMACPISEDTKLWIGVSTSSPANYRIESIAKGLNSIMYAIKEVR